MVSASACGQIPAYLNISINSRSTFYHYRMSTVYHKLKPELLQSMLRVESRGVGNNSVLCRCHARSQQKNLSLFMRDNISQAIIQAPNEQWVLRREKPHLQEEGSSWTNKRGAYKDSKHDKTPTTAENWKKIIIHAKEACILDLNRCIMRATLECVCVCVCARLRASTSPSVFFYMDFVFLLLKCCTVYVGFVHMCDCRVGGGGAGGGEGFSLCRPQVISKDQASLMSTGSSRGEPGVTHCTSHAKLSQPQYIPPDTAPCWRTWSPTRHI